MKNIFEIFKGILYRNKWFIIGLLGVLAMSALLVYMDQNIDDVENYLFSNEKITERAGEIKKLSLRTILTAYDPETQLPYTEYIYVVYGEKEKVMATVLIGFNDNTKRAVNSMNLVEIIPIE